MRFYFISGGGSCWKFNKSGDLKVTLALSLLRLSKSKRFAIYVEGLGQGAVVCRSLNTLKMNLSATNSSYLLLAQSSKCSGSQEPESEIPIEH
ncbi:hypothetical protein FGO68_gene2026 [Halteria grandinella]|uniref:Uncharacterized protein n=1 Tax=Halteria grandinella TaxID=5974 RepID=A0A8J8P3G3_HALGN|nr:hypothetical protein FGO68_gene2026 [Halteria grandinella]